MKAEIISANEIKLVPENDADNALLQLWANGDYKPVQTDSAFELKGVAYEYTINIGFDYTDEYKNTFVYKEKLSKT